AAAATAAQPAAASAPAAAPASSSAKAGTSGQTRVVASPLAKRIAAEKGIDLAAISGSGPNGRIGKAGLEGWQPGAAASAPQAGSPQAAAEARAVAAAGPAAADEPDEIEKLSGMRKTMARRLGESKQQVPHIFLPVDIRLDAL